MELGIALQARGELQIGRAQTNARGEAWRRVPVS